MADDFKALIEKFGTPKIVVPNAPRVLYLNSRGLLSGANPEDFENTPEPDLKMYHRRFKHGETEFLAVKKRFETWLGNEKLLLEYLKERNLKPVEFVYRYKDARTWDYSTVGWKDSKVSIAVEEDVEAVSRAELLEAGAEKRLLWVCGWSSMGDRYVDFHLCATADRLPTDSGYYFLFDAPEARLEEKMLVRMGKDFEWDEEFFNCYADYFARPFLLDK